MRGSFFTFAVATAVCAMGTSALAQQQGQNPTCQRLEAQLVSLDRGNADPQRADQIRRAEDAVNRQQFEVDKLVSQSRQMGCERSGFFSIFSNPPPQCGALVSRIGQQRSTLEQLRNQLERLSGGTTERAAQRQSLLIALSDNGCGQQYRAAAAAGQQGGFFDRLFGNNIISSSPGQMGGTFRTICVRTCDGYYFPISFSTSPDRFNEDAQTCQQMCPAAEVQLYTYHNPGEEVAQAVSLGGQPYTALPTAFQYRKAVNSACSCRRPGESWYEALRGGVDNTVSPGDVIVTEENARRLSQPRIGPDGKPIRRDPRQQAAPAAGNTAAQAEAPPQDSNKKPVRSVGPTFLPQQQQQPQQR